TSGQRPSGLGVQSRWTWNFVQIKFEQSRRNIVRAERGSASGRVEASNRLVQTSLMFRFHCVTLNTNDTVRALLQWHELPIFHRQHDALVIRAAVLVERELAGAENHREILDLLQRLAEAVARRIR